MPEMYVKKYFSEKKQVYCYFLVVVGYGREKRHLLKYDEVCEYLNLRPAELNDLSVGNYKLYDYSTKK